MVATLTRHYDVIDILDKVTVGWITPPNQPEFAVQGRGVYLESLMNLTRTDGVILVHKKYQFDREKLSQHWENRVWTFDVSIIHQSSVLLQAVFDQFREVFDRYTANPHSTATLGTGTTYTFAYVDDAEHQHQEESYTMDCKVTLVEQFVSVVIA